MANQMTPDELRIAAEDVDNWIDPTGNAHVAAQAARNLADVIEYVERMAGSNRSESPYVIERASHQSALRILAIARGDES